MLTLGLATAAAGASSGDEGIARIRCSTFDIDYRVSGGSLPLTAVQLWYTLDDGVTWHNYGVDVDGKSPFRFTAHREGPYGFFVVATNKAGPSSQPPRSGVQPQQTAFVDFTPPVVQFYPPRPGSADRPRTLHLKWTAIDAHLASRPIDLSYKRLSDEEPSWISAARGLANSGRYDWRVPDEVHGSIMMRIAVRDRGGNWSYAVSASIDVGAVFAPPASPATDEAPAGAPAPPRSQPTDDDRARARKLHRQADAHLARGRDQLAISRLRDAIAADPSLSEALVDLGRALYAVGDYEESIGAYERALVQDPTLDAASLGLADAHRATGRYDDAARCLHELLRRQPHDVRAWLALGDVERWRGDELSARDSYQRAATLDPTAVQVIEQAKRRLASDEIVRQTTGPLMLTQTPGYP